MAAALAFVSAVLLSQIRTSAAQSTPFDVSLACGSYANGCTCSAHGMVDNTAAVSTVFSNWETECCQPVTPQNCYGWSRSGGACPGAKFLVTAINSPSGDTPPDTCCTPAITATCSQVVCTARRRSTAQKYKAKAGVATTTCTSESHCQSTCCEKDYTMCMNNEDASTPMTCGSGKRRKQFEMHTVVGGRCNNVLTSVATATFSNEATYQSTCCETIPTPTPTPCPTAPACPSHMEVRTSVASLTYTSDLTSECCQNKATACLSLCSGGYNTQGGDACGVGGTLVCSSGTCTDADTVLDTTRVFQDGDDAAAKKTACCVPQIVTTCGQRKTAAVADAAAAAGSTSAAQCKGASTAVVVLAAFMVKLAL